MNDNDLNAINSLEYVSEKRGYWFVRTDNGVNFETYLKSGFIGIGWNDITLEDLTYLSAVDVQAKIAKTNEYDLEFAKGRSKTTAVYNKLKRFKEIAKGDVIIIPSNASYRLAFGIVEDSNIYIDFNKTDECEYYKRKKVKWVSVKDINSLDSKFYEIKITRHAISNIKPYESYIDRVISTFYFKDNAGNFVFDVNKQEDINLIHLLDLITNIQNLISSINIEFEYNERVEASVIKLSLQSKGSFALKVPIGNSLAMFGLILSLSSCNEESIQNDKLSLSQQQQAQRFIQNHAIELDTISKRMDDLEIDKNKINNAFR